MSNSMNIVLQQIPTAFNIDIKRKKLYSDLKMYLLNIQHSHAILPLVKEMSCELVYNR